jgi:hypothetical protein
MEISGRTILSGILDRKYVVRMAVQFAAVWRAYSDFQHFVAFETKLNIDDRRFIMVVQKRSAIPTFFLQPLTPQFRISEHYYGKRYVVVVQNVPLFNVLSTTIYTAIPYSGALLWKAV